MPAFVLADEFAVPAWVTDNEAFCRWALSADFPERGRFAYFNDTVWGNLDMENEDHNWLKSVVTAALTTLAITKGLGRVYSDRMMFSHPAAGVSTEPDGMFVSNATRQAGRVTVRRGTVGRSRGVILTGTPDMVLEIVSPSSVRKDTIEFVDQYWRAGIPEYWLIDPRGEEARFTLYARAADGYRAVRTRQGWRKSSVFGAEFRLTTATDELGLATYRLDVR